MGGCEYLPENIKPIVEHRAFGYKGPHYLITGGTLFTGQLIEKYHNQSDFSNFARDVHQEMYSEVQFGYFDALNIDDIADCAEAGIDICCEPNLEKIHKHLKKGRQVISRASFQDCYNIPASVWSLRGVIDFNNLKMVVEPGFEVEKLSENSISDTFDHDAVLAS